MCRSLPQMQDAVIRLHAAVVVVDVIEEAELDLVMPGVDGDRAFGHVRTIGVHLPHLVTGRWIKKRVDALVRWNCGRLFSGCTSANWQR